MLPHISVFLNPCAAKDFGKNHLRASNIALFTREICIIRSEDRFYLERTNFGKEIDKKDCDCLQVTVFRALRYCDDGIAKQRDVTLDLRVCV